MNLRRIGCLGIGAWAWFWSASFVFGAMRQSYSHVANTISELGAVGTPNAMLWNVIGFVIPGALLAIVGVVIARSAAAERSIQRLFAMVFLALAGLAIAGQGLLPAEMSNGVANIESAATRAHFISSLISGAAWVLGALLLVGPMKRNSDWRGLHLVSIALIVLTLLASFVLGGTLPDGLAQRIGNSFFCIWYILMSLRLVMVGAPRAAV